MKLKPPITNSTPLIDGWQSLQSHLNPLGESQVETSQADSPRLDNDSNLDSLQLADSQLDNVLKCTLCSKPVLQTSLEDHQATCPNSQNPPTLKRRLSQDSNPLEPKKSKITLHLNPSSSSFSSSTAPSDPLAPSTTTSLPNSTKPSPSPLPPSITLASQPPIPSTTSVPASDATQKKPKRVVDPDRQCCVINERGLPCQRSLTCKTHNMSSKRAVPHRSVSFDILLLEWQKASRIGKEREALSKGLRGGDTVMDESSKELKGVGKKKRGSLVEGLQGSPLSRDSTTLLPTHSPSSTSLKKSKKTSTSTSSLPLFTRVGEAPSRTASDEEGNQEQGFEESSDYLSSSDEVESVLLSIRKLPRGQALGGIREGGGSGWGAPGWWTGRNRKLARLRASIGSFGGGEGQGQGGVGGIFGSGNLQGTGNQKR